MNLYVDTCVLPRSRLQEAEVYSKAFGPSLGFELLPMFDLPDWEENLKKNLSLFMNRPLIFHEPVWGVEHSAPKFSKAWEEGMYHIRLTKKYADILRPTDMIFHLNNCIVSPANREFMLKNAMDNLADMRDLFSGVRLLVENTGTTVDGTRLLDQEEFTGTCLAEGWEVLIDVGHANANGWDLFRLVRDLRTRIRGFHLHNNDGVHDLHNRIFNGTLDLARLLYFIFSEVPDAFLVIEYCSPAFHGEPLLEDIRKIKSMIKTGFSNVEERDL